MESQMFDIVNSQKEKAMVRFNCFRRITKLWQFLEVLVILGLISWSSARAPAVFTAAVGYVVAISTALFNHHVVFLIGNAIIVLLFLLCRQNDAVSPPDSDLYSDYVKHSAAASAAADHLLETTNLPPPVEDEVVEKQIVMCNEVAIPQCDDVATAIEKATRQIKRFERTQSEKLKREIKTTPQQQLRRSENQGRRNLVSSGELLERLSKEEFQRRIDAFIDQHGFQKQKKIKQNEFDEYQKYQFLKIA